MSVLFLNVNFNGNDKLTGALEKMSGAAEKLEQSIGDTQKKVAELGRLNARLNGFDKTYSDINKTAVQLTAYKKIIADVQKQIDSGDKDPALLKRLKTLEKDAGKLQNTMDKYRKGTKELGAVMEEAGYKGMSFAKAQKAIADDIAKANAAIEKQKAKLDNLQGAQNRFDAAKNKSMAYMALATGAYQLGQQAVGALTIPVTIAINAEKSMADVAKVVDGLKIDGKITDEYRQMEREITDLSNRLGMSFSELTQIISGGAQGGIAKSELLRYGESAVKIGIAWDLAAEKVGQSMAELRSSFGLSQEGVEKLADQINYLGNNSTSAAPFLLDVVQYSGAIAKAANLGAESVAAMAAATSGIDSSTLGTGIKNIAYAMTAGENATKSQQKAWKQLGFTSEQVAKRMQTDAEGMYLDTLEALRKLPEEQRLAMAATIYGREAMPVVSQHLNNPEQLKQYLKDVKDLEKIQNSVNKEYESATTTTAFKMQKARVQIQNMGKDFGAHLLPLVGSVAEKIGNIAEKVGAWAKANPTVVQGLAKAAAAVTALLFGVAAIAGVMAAVVLPFSWLNLMIAKASGGALTLGGAFKMLLSPMSTIKTLWASLNASKFAVSMSSGLSKILPMLNPMRAIPAIMTAVKGGFVAAVGAVKSFAGGLVNGLIRFIPMLNPLKGIPAVLGLLKGGFIAAAGAVKSFGLALLANPMGLVIGALVVGAVLIYKYWGPVKDFLAGLWDGFSAGFAPVMGILDSFFGALGQIADALGLTTGQMTEGSAAARQWGEVIGGTVAQVLVACIAPLRALVEMFAWAVDSITGLLSGDLGWSDVGSRFMDKLSMFGDGISGWLQKNGELWDKATGKISSTEITLPQPKMADGGENPFASLSTSLEAEKSKIDTAAGTMMQGVETQFGAATPRLTAKADEMMSAVADKVRAGDGDIASTVEAQMAQSISGINTATQTMGAQLAGLLNTFGVAMAAIPTIASTAFSALPAITSIIFNSLVTIVAGSMISVINVISTTMSAVPMIAATTFGALPIVVATAVSSLPAIIAAALSALPAMMAGVFATLGAATLVGMAAVTRAVTTGMVQVVNAVRTGFGRVRATISSMWRSMGSAMSGNPILSRLQAAMNQAIGYLNGIKGRFVAIGRDISAGLAQGIRSGIGEVRAATAELASAVESAARIRLNTHSPSRVMMAVGSDTAAGLDVGLRQGFAPTLKNWTDNIGTLHRPIATPPIRATQPIMRGGGSGISHSYTGGAISITINAPAGSDQRAIAREVANELKKYERAQAAKRRASYSDYE